jgi:hypothetical protein
MYFENYMGASNWFHRQDKPHLHSVVNKFRSIRFNTELDIENEKLDNMILDAKTLKKIEQDGQNINLIKYLLAVTHIKSCINDVLDEHYKIESSDYRFLEANDNRKGKYSHRIYMKLAFANIAEYKHFIKLLKDEVRPEICCMIDPTSSMLRTVGSYKDNHALKWITEGCKFEDSVLSHTDVCDDLPEIAPDEVHIETLITKSDVKKAVALLAAHDYIMGTFNYAGDSDNLLKYKRIPGCSTQCSICDRTHDASDCYATIYRGNVYIRCYRDEHKKFIYVGFIGETPAPMSDFKWRDIRGMVKKYENTATGLSNKEQKLMAGEHTKMVGDIGTEAAKNSTNFMEISKGEFGFVYDHFVHIHKKTFTDEMPIIKYIEAAIFKITQGGAVFYITKSVWQKTKHFTELKNSVFKGDDSISYNIINKDFKTTEPVSKSNQMTLVKDLGTTVVEYLKTHFHKTVDFEPCLHAETADPEIFNLFEGYRFKYTDQKYEPAIENGVNIPTATPRVQPWISHIINAICAGNRKHARILIQWMSHIIQKPTEKSFAVLIYGKQGTGKSILYEFFKNAIGPDLGLQVSKLEDLTQTHNKIVRGRLIINCNEATNYPSIRDTNILKAFITETALLINPKNCPLYYIANYSRLMTTTNCRFSARFDYDDRRWWCAEVDEKNKNNDAYFKPLIDTMKNEEVLSEFFNYLANFDISDFKCQRPPMTTLKRSMIGEQMPHVVEFMKDTCENAAGSIFPETVEEMVEKSTEFYKSYKVWCDDSGCKAFGRQKFNGEMDNLFGIKNTQYRHEGKRFKGFKINRADLIPKFKELLCNEDFVYDIETGDELAM